jgi:fumarate reductase subunit D
VVFGTALALSLLLALLAPLFLLVPGAAEVSTFVLFLIGNVIPLIMLLIPLSVGTAMLRSGLFDIDLVINRALVYGALSAMLALVYIGSVVALQWAFGTATGQGSHLAIVASTLAIAVLFGPLRRSIQGLVDRHFYRRKYDAARTLEDFGARLRNETDLYVLTGDLVGVVSETVQPTRVSLWLKDSLRDRGPMADG